MTIEQFQVPAVLAGTKALQATCKMLPYIPRQQVLAAFNRRDVKMDGVRIKRETPLVVGAMLQVYLPNHVELVALDIVYEDQNLLVVNKPSGVSCEPDDRGGMTIVQWIYHVKKPVLDQIPMLCHRLDNPTDGLLILAKTLPIQIEMQEAFRRREIHKKYVCIVRGTPTPATAVLDAYLWKDAEHASVRILKRPIEGAVPIRTGYRVLERGDASRLEITLYTGRTHQIRAHMASIGHPLLGDDKYGDREFNRKLHANRLMLTATELTFSITGQLSYLNQYCITITPSI